MATTELRSIYSGPVRRGLNQLDHAVRMLQTRVGVGPDGMTAKTWTPLTLIDGWAIGASGTRGSPCCRVVGDEVQLYAYLQHANAPTPSNICILPIEARPPYPQALNAAYYYGDSPSTYTVISIEARPDGSLVYNGAAKVHFLVLNDTYWLTVPEVTNGS